MAAVSYHRIHYIREIEDTFSCDPVAEDILRFKIVNILCNLVAMLTKLGDRREKKVQ